MSDDTMHMYIEDDTDHINISYNTKYRMNSIMSVKWTGDNRDIPCIEVYKCFIKIRKNLDICDDVYIHVNIYDDNKLIGVCYINIIQYISYVCIYINHI